MNLMFSRRKYMILHFIFLRIYSTVALAFPVSNVHFLQCNNYPFRCNLVSSPSILVTMHDLRSILLFELLSKNIVSILVVWFVYLTLVVRYCLFDCGSSSVFRPRSLVISRYLLTIDLVFRILTKIVHFVLHTLQSDALVSGAW